MKQMTSYQCETCKQIYNDEGTAISCEETHVAGENLEIVEVFHDSDSSNYGFPMGLLLEINDYSRCLAEYKKVHEGPVEEFAKD